MHLKVLTIFIISFFFPSIKAFSETTTCSCSEQSTSNNYCFKWSCRTEYKSNSACFSSKCTVQTHNGQHIPLSTVEIGDEVLTFNGKELVFEPIYDFIHAEKVGFYNFLRLTVFNTVRNSTSHIDISAQHLIFVSGKSDPIFASEVQVGDHLQLVDNNQVIPSEVISIEPVVSQGFSAPLTRSGTIVVNGIIASNYAEARNHHLAHLAMQPYRLWRMLVGAKRSISNEVNWYAKALRFFAQKTAILLTL